MILKAIILGAVQGISEFFPISSSGHLSLLCSFMNIQPDLTFVIMVHLGSLLAIFLYFFREIKKCALELWLLLGDIRHNIKEFMSYRGGLSGPDYRKLITNSYRKITVMLLTAMIPTGIVAILFYNIADYFNGNLLFSGVGLFITAMMLTVASLSERTGKGPREAGITDAILVGTFQGFSVFPGVSRLAMTLSAGFFSGFTAKFNRLFCFLLFVPTITGAIVFEGASNNRGAASMGVLPCLLGMLSAMVVGYFTIGLAIRILSRLSIRKIAYYCFIIGMISVVFYLV